MDKIANFWNSDEFADVNFSFILLIEVFLIDWHRNFFIWLRAKKNRQPLVRLQIPRLLRILS